MKKFLIFCFIASQAIAFGVNAQPKIDSIESAARESDESYDAIHLGSLNGAMRSCFLNYKSTVYFNVYQETTKIINSLGSISRNQAMGTYQRVLSSRIFEGRFLSIAECERIVASDWVNFIELPPNLYEK